MATHHRDPKRLQLAERLARHHSPAEDALGVPEVIRSGRALLYSDITPAALAAYAENAEHLKMLEELAAKSMLIVPLAAPTRTIGAITLVSAESPKRLFQHDVALAKRLGRRAGTAVESARLYTARKRIADILQSALLPESLPEVPGVQTHALYRAAGELNRVGGDFYDVCDYGQGRWMLAIGDVCGKGPRAAGVTALARHTLRAAAMLGQSPEGMLRTLHEALSRQPAGADMCTVCLVIIEPEENRARLTVALGGHPPPVLIDDGGSAAQIGRPGTLLGVLDALRIHEVECELLPGETLLLYTDGVPEAGAPAEQIGEAGLLALCAEAPNLSLESFLARIALAASERAPGGLRDDIALLGVRLGGVG